MEADHLAPADDGDGIVGAVEVAGSWVMVVPVTGHVVVVVTMLHSLCRIETQHFVQCQQLSTGCSCAVRLQGKVFCSCGTKSQVVGLQSPGQKSSRHQYTWISQHEALSQAGSGLFLCCNLMQALSTLPR